jgi:hypothetical protein
MENITFTREQLNDFMMMTDGMNDYNGGSETFPVFDDFCEEVFGDDWSELIGEWDDLFNMEFEADPYIYLSTGIMTNALMDWRIEGEKILSQILED